MLWLAWQCFGGSLVACSVVCGISCFQKCLFVTLVLVVLLCKVVLPVNLCK